MTTNHMETTIPLGRLVPSKLNVRRVDGEAGKAALAASIAAHGLIQNLVVRKAAAKASSRSLPVGGSWGTTAAVERRRQRSGVWSPRAPITTPQSKQSLRKVLLWFTFRLGGTGS